MPPRQRQSSLSMRSKSTNAGPRGQDTHLQKLEGWEAKEWEEHGWDRFHFEHPTVFLDNKGSRIATHSHMVHMGFIARLAVAGALLRNILLKPISCDIYMR